MKRSQINYAIDKAHAIAEAFRICLPPMLYHRFWAERSFVMGWEISMVNDDKNDNHFLQASGRFPTIQEDEPIKWLLCSEYER